MQQIPEAEVALEQLSVAAVATADLEPDLDAGYFNSTGAAQQYKLKPGAVAAAGCRSRSRF